MKIEKKYLEQAKKMHKQYPVVDTHMDLAGEIYYRYRAGETEVIKNHYLSHWKEAGLNVLVSSIYLEDEVLPESGLRIALDQISVLLADIGTVKEDVMQIKTKSDLQEVIANHKIGIIIYMEGLDCIGSDLYLLRAFWEMGVRGASLTWSRRNQLAQGCCKAKERIQISGGLSSHGKEAIHIMEDLGIFIDISHLNDDGFEDLIKETKRPFIATHSNVQTVSFNYRNLTDRQMQILAKQGGIMGLNACKSIVGVEDTMDVIEKMCEHLEYEVNLLGDKHSGYGLDLCDSYIEIYQNSCFADNSKGDCLKHHGELVLVTAALLQRGMCEESVIRIIGKNFVQYFQRMLP